jgi:signal transduction histidine kinase
MLERWHAAVVGDPAITTVASLARAQFVDHVPKILDAFERQLLAQGKDEDASEAQRAGAAEHGLERWRQGYHYRETLSEWGHLQTVLVHEVETFGLDAAGLDPAAMVAARMLLTKVLVDCMVESGAGHARLVEAEAASRLRDLEQVLAEVRALEQRRAQLWHEAAHDLRGNVNAVQLATAVLAQDPAPPRTAAVGAVERTTRHLVELLDDLVALARLEAGRETRAVASFDAAAIVGDVCRGLAPMSGARGLELICEGPVGLDVEGDAIKVRRIVQNLVVNAIRYTERGRVEVAVSRCAERASPAWELRVADTGVGFSERPSPAIAEVLRIATREAGSIGGRGRARAQTLPSSSPAPVAHVAPGEGVGLAIVKRLCELLDASIDVESAPGRGTTFRIVFPAEYGVGDR